MARAHDTWKVMALTSGVYLAAAALGGALSSASPFATLWPANGVLVAILLRNEPRRWPHLVMACWPANLLFNAWEEQPFLLSHAYWMANMVESLAVATAMRRLHGRVTFERLAEVGTLGGASMAGSMLGALIGAGATFAWQGVEFAGTWRSWWLSDLLGILIVAPVLLTWPSRRQGTAPPAATRECIVFGTLLAVIAVADVVLPTFGVKPANFLFPLTVPIVGWAALRLGVPGTSWAVLVSSLLIVFNHVRGVGELVGLGGFTQERAVVLQAILSGMSMTFLALAAAVRESRTSTERLLRREQSREALVATMTHEIRNPVSVILASLELAETPAAARAGVDPLAAIERAARQILETVEDALELSRSDAGAAPRRQDVWLPALWRDVRADFEAMPRSPDVVLRWKTPAPEVTLVTDRSRLTTVLRNLVANALKFTDRGHVSVECRVDAGTVTFTVEDTGIGISGEDQERIFALYQRGTAADARRRHGTGIGLYLVHRYATECGASVSVKSALGRGSTFVVTFADREGATHVA